MRGDTGSLKKESEEAGGQMPSALHAASLSEEGQKRTGGGAWPLFIGGRCRGH